MQRLTGLGIILRNSENWTIIKFHLVTFVNLHWKRI